MSQFTDDKSRNGSNYESVRFASIHQSVKTPYTDIGTKKSVYNGWNTTLKNWYGKDKNLEGFDRDNYSMFSKSELKRQPTEKNKAA